VFRAGSKDVTRVPRRWTRQTPDAGGQSCSAPDDSTDARRWMSLVFRAGRLDRSTDTRNWTSLLFRAGRLDRQTDTRNWTSLVFRAGGLDTRTPLDVTRVPRRRTGHTKDTGRLTSLVFRAGGLDPQTAAAGRQSCYAPVDLIDRRTPDAGGHECSAPDDWTHRGSWTSLVFRAGGLD
jgi:hypothetical protein